MAETKRKRGRPKKEGVLDDRVAFKTTKGDKCYLRMVAAKNGMSLTAYCRSVLLSGKEDIDNDEYEYDDYDRYDEYEDDEEDFDENF